MTVYRSVRLQMPDVPGALSAISKSLAIHRVDIVRLDVVSHEDGVVIDDLLLGAAAQEDIGEAIAGFAPEVTVRTFDTPVGDPALDMGHSLRRVATATGVEFGRQALLDGAAVLARADTVLLLRAAEDGSFTVVASTAVVGPLGAAQPFAGRWVLERRAAAAFPASPGWAPADLQHALSASWVALAPVSAFDLVVAARRSNIPFYVGELERFAAFAETAGAILGCLGDRQPFAAIPAYTETALPPRAVTLARRVPIG